mgnify:CR=1 FL=1
MLEFPKWKYALIVLVLLASVVYALPNIFPQEPAVQVLDFRLDEVREARLVPEIDFKGRRFLPAAPQDAARGGGGAAGVGGGRWE